MKIKSITFLTLLCFALLSPAQAVTGASSTQVPAAGKCVVVKNVVGKNYQKAQDIWRAQGFWVMPAKRCNWSGRSPWIDSSWFVTAQSPKAGSCVKKGSNVRATVKKYTD